MLDKLTEIEIFLDLFMQYKNKNQYEEEYARLELIRPEDTPPNKDSFPKSPPNKRVIIIDI